jgi:hypothetical protein
MVHLCHPRGRAVWLSCAGSSLASRRAASPRGYSPGIALAVGVGMNNIIYIVGLVVVVAIVLSFLGLR